MQKLSFSVKPKARAKMVRVILLKIELNILYHCAGGPVLVAAAGTASARPNGENAVFVFKRPIVP